MPIRGMRDQRELDQQRLKELTFIDDLSGLYNRRYLYQYLPSELKDMQRLGKKVCLFMMDVDNFKEINDTYGHLYGDKVLVQVAQLLRKSFREGDTIVRYAGDEFLAILPGADEQMAISIAKRTVELIGKNPFRENKDRPAMHLTISIGLSFFPSDGQDPEKLIYQADQALYLSKRSGRNRVSTTKDITSEVLDETRLANIFPSAKLIGRKYQLNGLKATLDAANQGQSKFTLIKGERGIGKTRLINELKGYAHLEGITNLSTICSPDLSGQPYSAILTALADLFGSLGTQLSTITGSLSEAQMAQLAHRIPVLKQYLPKRLQNKKISNGKQGQMDLFKGVCQSIVSAAKKKAMLLIIDDFHWIDKETIELFNYIIKDLANLPIFVAAVCREQELNNRTDSVSITKVWEQMHQYAGVDELTLEPLEKEDTLEMIKTIFQDIYVDEDFVNMIYDLSGGNPLFTEELLRSLVSKGFIFYEHGQWRTKEVTASSLPSFLKEAIQKRFAELDDETKPVIQAAAVIGEAFAFDILCQLLEKDAGYILEVIDRAIKQYLIMSEGPFQTDRFKFRSEAVRDLIYAALDSQQKRDLHKRLALIEEKANKGNIDDVAGSLGYHFAKGQDTKKADLYTNMLLEKLKYRPTYQDTLDFFRELPFFKKIEKERELEKGPAEEQVLPLNPANFKLVPTMLRCLNLAMTNIRLYPPHSKIRQENIEEFYRIITSILDTDNTLVVSSVGGFLLINGKEISEKASREAGGAAIIALMKTHRIRSMIFKKNVTADEIVIFLQTLGRGYDELIEEGGLVGKLQQEDIQHIKVGKIRYEQPAAQRPKGMAKIEEPMLIDYLLGKISHLGDDKLETTEALRQIANNPLKLAEALKKIAQESKVEEGKDSTQAQANLIAKSLQKLSERVSGKSKVEMAEYRKNIAEALMSLNRSLRTRIVRTQAKADKISTDKTGPNNIVKEAIKEFSEEELLEMITQEFFDSQGDLSSLRALVSNLAQEDPAQRQNLLPKIKNKLSQLGMNEEEAQWVLGEEFWETLPVGEKAERILKLNPKSYARLEMSKQVDNLVSQLLESDQYTQASQILDKLINQLEDSSKDVRAATIKDLRKISETLIFKEKYFLLEQLVNNLIARLDKESDPQVYSLLTQLLATICVTLIKRQNFMQATGILKAFNLRLAKTSKLLDIQKQAIRIARDNIIATNSLITRLTELFEARIEAHHDFYELSKVIAEIGPAVIGPLFELGISKELYVDPFKAYALRWSIAKTFKEIGEPAFSYLKDMLMGSKLEVVKTTLELLGHMQNKKTVPYLQPLLKSKNLELCKETINTLGKIGGPEAVKLLSTTIKDQNSELRLASIWALVGIGSPEAKELLKPLLKEGSLPDKVKRTIRRLIQ